MRDRILVGVVIGLVWSSPAAAQLVECDQVDSQGNVDAPGGCIAKTLQQQIGAGQGDVDTPGSSAYLIARDPFRSIRRGRQLFQRKFSTDEGQGPRVSFGSVGDITQMRALGAGLADSCAACHGRPRGSAGHGGDVNTFPDSRDAPHLFGLGIVEQLADEMTVDLRAIRDQAIQDAMSGAGVIMESDFVGDTAGFVYIDDTFNGTDNPTYASGHHGKSRLRVRLGNVDNHDIVGMSGGWQRTLEVSGEVDAVIRVNFVMVQAPNYEAHEYSQALLAVDGVDHELATLYGDGNGGDPRTTGPTDAEIEVHLLPGSHTLTLGGYNNEKTHRSEVTRIRFDSIVITGGPGGPVTRSLSTKGIDFGAITALGDGSVDTSQVQGVNEDLRVRPFFHHGATISIREFIVGALNDEMGLQAWDPVLCLATDPVNPQTATSASGFVFDPALDGFARPPACVSSEDPDGDGVAGEIDPALVDHLEFYLLNYFKPGQYRVTQRTQQGLAIMGNIGCTSCHVQNLVIERDRRVADVETVYDPVNGIFNEMFATATARMGDPIEDGAAYPQLPPAGEPFVVANFFSDLKRHNLGPKCEERDFDGSTIQEHVTEPLWGVGSTSPYGHDGRSINLDQVIRRHGGEAQAVTQAYESLSENDQRKVIEFLQSLVLFPPDDTASNLNPGHPGSDDPQHPDNHGTINLGALFQIPDEGAE